MESVSPEFDEIKGIVETGKVRAGENILDPTLIEGKYPEYKEICPKVQGGVMISINSQYLLDICKYADKGEPIHIMMHGETKPLEVKGTVQGESFYALIMPMHGYGKEGFYNAFQPHDTIPTPQEEESTPQEEPRIFDFYHDPGHGWIKVPMAETIELDISPYSYMSLDGEWAYLEEDMDAGTFIKSLPIEPNWNEIYDDKGFVRSLPRYQAPKAEEIV
jgi:hypothetical protein